MKVLLYHKKINVGKTSFLVAYSIPERGGKNIKLLNIHA